MATWITRYPLARRITGRVLAFGLSLLCTACARPMPGARLDPVTLARPQGTVVGGALSYEAALKHAITSSPELQSLAHAIEGAGGWPTGSPLGLSAGTDSDGRPELGVGIDILSIFGMGPWRAERVLADLRRSEATLALGARARELAYELAEAFAVSAALAEPAPELKWVDPKAFVKAGLTTSAASSAVEAARQSLTSQGSVLEAEREQARLRVRRVLGLSPEDALELIIPTGGWPEVPAPSLAAVLASDPGVQRRIGAYEVARGELLRAQAERDPGIELDPALALDPTHFFGAVTVRLPLGAEPGIRAAHARMEAARLAVRAEVLRAIENASAARVAWQATEGTLAAARARLAAAIRLADAQRAQVEAEGDGLTEALLAIHDVVGSLEEVRSAMLEAARARVRAATAAGWPLPAMTQTPGSSRCPSSAVAADRAPAANPPVSHAPPIPPIPPAPSRAP